MVDSTEEEFKGVCPHAVSALERGEREELINKGLDGTYWVSAWTARVCHLFPLLMSPLVISSPSLLIAWVIHDVWVI
jgi:hypothetical protein